jgi:hypothetical protein
MKTERLCWILPLLLANAGLLLLSPGCATEDVHSYNADYGQHLDCAPNYSVENGNDTSFKIHMLQGSPSTGPARVIYMKQATREVAATEAKRRGWQNWDVNYVEDRDQGWMHVLVAEVTRKNPVEPVSSPPANNP